MSCKARRSPVGRTYLQEELGIDGWVDKKKKGRKEGKNQVSG